MATPIPPNESSWTLDDLVQATGGVALRTAQPVSRSVGAFTDSRSIPAGAVFVPIRGETMDGHAFISAAIERGATAIVVERGREVPVANVNVVGVSDTLAAWGAMGAFHLHRWRAANSARRVVAITGSAGKTTTKELTAVLLAAAGRCHATRGNLNNRVGVPAVALAVGPDVDFVVFEIGMSVPGEIAGLAEIVVPDVGLVTNIGVAHSLGVGGRDGVAREKGALFAGLPEGAIAIVNVDDAAIEQQTGRLNGCDRVSFGAATGADYRLLEVTSVGAGSHVRVSRPIRTAGAVAREELVVSLPLPGRMNAVNLLGALAAADTASGRPLTPAEIQHALSMLTIPSGRSAITYLSKGVTLIDDSYNSNPTSMDAALQVLSDLCSQGIGRRRAVVVFGDMLELGADSLSEHRRIAGQVSAMGVSLAIGCGEVAGAALEEVAGRGLTVYTARTAAEAAPVLLKHIHPGDVVLVKGSRGIRTEVVVAELTRSLLPGAADEVR